MVVLVKLEARKFRKLDLEIEFPKEGVLVIKGPNEAGKSTVLEAILYALFGKTCRGTRELAINHGSNMALIRLWFKVDEREYLVERVLRRRGAPQARLYCLTGGSRIIASGARRTNNEIIGLLGGLTMKEMLVTNVVAQKELDKIVRLETRERDKVINLLMGLESYNKAIVKLEEDRRYTKKDLEAKREVLEEKRKAVEQYRKDIKDLELKRRELGRAEGEFKELQEELQEAENLFNALEKYRETLKEKERLERELKSCKDRISLIDNSIEDAERKISNKEREAEECSKSIAEIKEKLEEMIKREEELGDVENVSNKMKTLEKELLEIKSLQMRIEELKRSIKELESKLRVLEERIREFRLDELLRAKRTVEEKLEATRPSKVLILCLLALSLLGLLHNLLFLLGPISAVTYYIIIIIMRGALYRQLAEISSKKGEHDRLVSEYENTGKTLDSKRKELVKNNRTLLLLKEKVEKELLNLEDRYRPSEWTDLEELYEKTKANAYSLLEKKREIVGEMRTLRERLKDREEQLQRVNRELAEARQRVEELREQRIAEERKMRELKAQLESIVFPELPEGVRYTEDLYETVKKDFYELRDRLNLLKGRIEELKTSIADLKRRIEENKNVEAEYERVREEVLKLERLVDAQTAAIYAIKDVSKKLREAFRPTIENYMSRIISRITGGRYKAVRLNERFDVEVFDSSAGRFIPKDIYSGGTVDQFLLAMRLAFILSLLPHTKQAYPRFLFLDEPLASSDVDRRRNILELLTEDMANYFKQIILITHLDIAPPNSTVIELEEGKVARRVRYV